MLLIFILTRIEVVELRFWYR